ncbi:hypothetical protein N9Y33_04225 [Bacteroidia bacterium]|nr:hypothetical protein [Bacteroidia bacterium]
MPQNNSTLTKDASIEDVFSVIKKTVPYIRRYKRVLLFWILGLGLMGGGVGLFLKKDKRATFIIAAEQEGSAGWDGLLAQFGLDIGGSNPGGIFEGESLVSLFKVRTLIERSLLKPINTNSDTTIAQRIFPEVKGSEDPKFVGLKFGISKYKKNKLHDTAMFLIYRHVTENLVSVFKPEKKQSFIHVQCDHPDEQVALMLGTSLIETVTQFYVESLTKKAKHNLNVLKLEADSVRRVLNDNIKNTAQYMDLNINPLTQMARVNQNRSTIDLQISVSLYGEIVKNLKLAEIGLRKQTPLIQLIEKPHFPLDHVGWKIWQTTLIGLVLGLLMAIRTILSRIKQGEVISVDQ